MTNELFICFDFFDSGYTNNNKNAGTYNFGSLLISQSGYLKIIINDF